MEGIPSRLEAFAIRLDAAIAIRLDAAIASRLEAIATRLDAAIATRLEAIASRLEAMATRNKEKRTGKKVSLSQEKCCTTCEVRCRDVTKFRLVFGNSEYLIA